MCWSIIKLRAMLSLMLTEETWETVRGSSVGGLFAIREKKPVLIV